MSQKAKSYALTHRIFDTVLANIAKLNLTDDEILKRLKDAVENSKKKIRKGASSKTKHHEQRDNWFEKHDIRKSDKDLILKFLQDNRIKGWF